MAQETRAQLYAKILANLPDNTTELIMAAITEIMTHVGGDFQMIEVLKRA